MRCVVLGMRNAVRCEIKCYGDMVIWPALQARASHGKYILGGVNFTHRVRDMMFET